MPKNRLTNAGGSGSPEAASTGSAASSHSVDTCSRTVYAAALPMVRKSGDAPSFRVRAAIPARTRDAPRKPFAWASLGSRTPAARHCSSGTGGADGWSTGGSSRGGRRPVSARRSDSGRRKSR